MKKSLFLIPLLLVVAFLLPLTNCSHSSSSGSYNLLYEFKEDAYYTIPEVVKFLNAIVAESEYKNKTYTFHVKDDFTKSCEDLYEALLGLTFEEGTTEEGKPIYRKNPYEGPYIILDLENATSLEIGERALQGYPMGTEGYYGYALKEVILPKTCTYIEDHAFIGQASLEKVTLPKGLEIMGSHAFLRCLKLKEINLESCTSLKYIGMYAFQYDSLEEVTLPENLEELCCEAFRENEPLRKVDMSSCKHLKYIGQDAFWKCPNLEEITLYDSRKEGYEWGHGGYDSDSGESICLEHYENPTQEDDFTIVYCFQDNLVRCFTAGLGYFTCTCGEECKKEEYNENEEEEGCNCKEIGNKTKSGGEYHWYRVSIE